jgi:peptide/nickel transport system ATP-binding protein
MIELLDRPAAEALVMQSPPKIEVRGLEFLYGKTRALNAVDLAVPANAVTAIIGPSGCGKSTLLRAVCGLNRDWQGEIRVDGEAVGPRRAPRLHRHVQMVFQDPYGSLHPRHSVDAILAEPIAIHGLGDASRRINAALDQVGLGRAFRFRFPHQLSGGQRQRVAIARAIILEPRLLLLDEPTSALDVSIQAEVLNLLSDLKRERGLTYLLVSHDLGVVAHMCERVGVMRAGRIVEETSVRAMREGRVQNEYTRRFIEASAGYDRTMVSAWTRHDEMESS